MRLERMVADHVSNAKAKLGVETRLKAALWARERDLVGSKPHTS